MSNEHENWPRLSSDEVHVWVANLTTDFDYDKFWKILSQDEQQRAQRFKSIPNKNSFIFGRAALRYLISNYLKLPSEVLTFVYNQYGKPQLTSSTLQFNISHTNNMILFAFTRDFNVGVDVEYINREINFRALAKRFFTQNEIQKLLSLHDDVQVENFFRYWTRKEAISKALGVSIFNCLHKFDVSDLDRNNIHNHWLYEIPLATPFYIATLAAQSPISKIFLYHWHEIYK